ncbi:MAG: hypothetical protein GC181_11010 [Bacteroidetes bacterium]|nr:hypothetical protein [Bacteroidota bacterium]
MLLHSFRRASRLYSFALFLFIFNSSNTTAQHNTSVTIPEVALISVQGVSGTTVYFGLTGPTEAGLGFEGGNQFDSTLWLNYSSVVGTSKPKKDVYVSISSGNLPGGFTLSVKAAPNNGNGNGNVGTSIGWITLTSSDQKIIENIRTGYTDKGNGKGHRLIYHLEIDNIGDVDADDQATLQITYTISD